MQAPFPHCVASLLANIDRGQWKIWSCEESYVTGVQASMCKGCQEGYDEKQEYVLHGGGCDAIL